MNTTNYSTLKTPLITVDTITEKAEDAFWQVIVQQSPHATTGDLSPEATIGFSIAARAAAFEWIANNAATRENDVVKGYRFRLFRKVDRCPDFLAPDGLTGIVTTIDDSGVWAQMDQLVAGTEEWNNQIHWPSPDEFAADTVPMSTSDDSALSDGGATTHSDTRPLGLSHSPAPWTYGYNPYTVQSEASPLRVGAEIPAYEIVDADGNRLFNTDEDSPAEVQRANAALASTAPRLLAALIECARLLADYDEADGEGGDAYREAVVAIAKATRRAA